MLKIRAAEDPNGSFVEKRVYNMRRIRQLSRQSTEMENVGNGFVSRFQRTLLSYLNPRHPSSSGKLLKRTTSSSQSPYVGLPPEAASGEEMVEHLHHRPLSL